MDPDTLRLLSDWGQYVLTGLAGGLAAVWATLGRRDRALGGRIDGLAQQLTDLTAGAAPMARCAAHSERMAGLEARLAATVTADRLDHSIVRAHQRMDGFESRIAKMEGILEGIDRTVNRIEQHMIEHGPRAGDR